jgi:hypothetical protein
MVIVSAVAQVPEHDVSNGRQGISASQLSVPLQWVESCRRAISFI